MKLLWAVIFFSFPTLIFSQSKGELINQLHEAKDDTLKIEIYQNLIFKYLGKKFDSTYYYANKGLELSKQLNYDEGIMVMNNYIATSYFNKASYDSALIYYMPALKISEKKKNYASIGKLQNNIGLIYYYEAKYDSALKFFFKARTIREEKDQGRLGSTYNNIGLVYKNLQEYDEAIKFFKKGLIYKKKYSSERSLSTSYNNIGIIYKIKKEYDSALTYYHKALDVAINTEDKVKQAHAYNNLALLYGMSTDKLDLAEKNYLKSIRLKEELGEKAGLFNSYHNYSNFLTFQERYQEAWMYIKKADKLEAEIGKNLHSYAKMITKANVLEATGRYKEALSVTKKAQELRYEELSEDKNAKIAEMETKYETAQKESKIKTLSLSNNLKAVELSRAKAIQASIIIGALLLLTFLIIFIILRSKKLKAEKEAQLLQMEALQKRFIELHSSPAEIAVALEIVELNEKLYTPLTSREFDVLKLSIEGKTNVEIGDALFISISAVKFHLRNTYSKMGVKNRKEAFKQILKSS